MISRKSYRKTAKNIKKLDKAKAGGVRSEEDLTTREIYKRFSPKGTAAARMINTIWTTATRFFQNSRSTIPMPSSTQQ